MFSQEFALPDVIRLWDSVLSATEPTGFLVAVAVAMVVLQRDAIRANDFAANVKLLQVRSNLCFIYLHLE